MFVTFYTNNMQNKNKFIDRKSGNNPSKMIRKIKEILKYIIKINKKYTKNKKTVKKEKLRFQGINNIFYAEREEKSCRKIKTYQNDWLKKGGECIKMTNYVEHTIFLQKNGLCYKDGCEGKE